MCNGRKTENLYSAYMNAFDHNLFIELLLIEHDFAIINFIERKD